MHLRLLAQQARLNATGMWDDDAAEGIREYADELEAKAVALEGKQGA